MRSNVREYDGYKAPELIFETRGDADEVLVDMKKTLHTYGYVTVADMLDMVDGDTICMDEDYGWTSLITACVIRIRDGYIINLPRPVLLNCEFTHNRTYKPEITRVIFNDPATIVFWSDGTKTVVKCDPRDEFDPEKGLAMAIAKKSLGNNYKYYEVFERFIPSTCTEMIEIKCDTGLMNETLTIVDKLREEANKQRHDLVRKAYEILKANREFNEFTDIDKLIDCLGEALGIRKEG